jgi:aminobenzoyl-glutamate utilization protein B
MRRPAPVPIGPTPFWLLPPIVLLALAVCSSVRAATTAPPSLDEAKQEVFRFLQEDEPRLARIGDAIFSYAELGFQETLSAKLLTDLLEKEGFTIDKGVAGIPTAFVATFGSGHPVIGLMGDIDALPGRSQKPGVAYEVPLVEGAPGHGEGHNTNQAVVTGAALAVKGLMERYHLKGTIRVYPGVAEELVGSRGFMAKAGVFKGLDAMLDAHLGSSFGTSYGLNNMGMVSVLFTFHGRSAHSAASPWLGRSALDAVTLMEVGWNFAREHLRPEQRSHSVFPIAGDQPNVVPDLASAWYYFREVDYEHIKALHEKGSRIAAGAAMMTDTTFEERVLAGTWPFNGNRALATLLQRNIERAGMPRWSEDDLKLAKALQKELGVREEGLETEVRPLERATQGASSTDAGDVTWLVPYARLSFPSQIPGVTFHHWSSGVSPATPLGHKGIVVGAEALAATVLDLLMEPRNLDPIRAQFDEDTKGITWTSLIPEGNVAPIETNVEKMDHFRPLLEPYFYDLESGKTYLEQLGIDYPTVRK